VVETEPFKVPNIFLIASRTLTFPATSVRVESHFSRAKQILPAHRKGKMKTKTFLDALLVNQADEGAKILPVDLFEAVYQNH